MNILILGGTGAMGVPLVNDLSKVATNNIYVTSRKKHISEHNIRYIQGNACDDNILMDILKLKEWDAIVDFLVHGEKFEHILPFILDSTKQYVFISSARIYSESDSPITENTPRLLDVSKDVEYLKTNEYALAKARQENLLFNSGRNNFTIIRPSITYNNFRLQLGVLEKENWLYRALHGRTIVFSNDIADKITTNTLGDDVAKGIASIIGQKEALNQAFHITCNHSLKWRDVLEIYLVVLEKHFGKKIPVKYTEKSTNFKFKDRIYQIIYCRYFNRSYDNSKINQFCDIQLFTDPHKGLTDCLSTFLWNPSFSYIDWRIEAVNDRVVNERTPLNEIPSLKDKIYYLLYRYDLSILILSLNYMIKALKTFKHKIHIYGK
jgi:nucleoside-diphosphate-sugar epimerase